VTLGHALVETVVAVFILAGLSILIGNYVWLIAGVGGISLVIFGFLTIIESRKAQLTITEDTPSTSSPLLAGVVTSISNPYFWLWWITVGSALLIGALQGGIVIAIAFILGHWAADLGWLTLVSTSIHKGKFILREKEYRLTIGLCGVFLVCFGGYYLSTVDLITSNS
jgi:threonine/homoserine/homoserine lactone efflux protein